MIRHPAFFRSASSRYLPASPFTGKSSYFQAAPANEPRAGGNTDSIAGVGDSLWITIEQVRALSLCSRAMTTFDAHTGLSLDERLLRTVAAWRARRGMSARRFGLEALGDPNFVGRVARGRSVKLETADRVLAFMGHPPLGPLLRAEVETFLAVSGTKLSILGEEAVGNPSFVGRLRRGASPRLATMGRVRAWMADNATEEEIRAVCERLADMADPFEMTWDAAGDPPRGSGDQGDVVERAKENHLNTREAAAWLGLSPKTLERYRVSGEGPDFRRFGSRVRYLLIDLESWASERRWTSTSEERGARKGKRR